MTKGAMLSLRRNLRDFGPQKQTKKRKETAVMNALKSLTRARRRKVCAAVATLTATAVWAASPEITVGKGSPLEVGGVNHKF